MADVKFNVAEVTKNLKGVEFPADKNQILETAQENGASEEVIQMLQKLPEGEQFNSPTEVMESLSDEQDSGETGEMSEMDEVEE
ncbi:DUF2795 domain-containing protein [Candidatus Parcubacteria bacterium]|nr:DUF2795 domain-containing protein [Candidatus Parcubacteria bacterium]